MSNGEISGSVQPAPLDIGIVETSAHGKPHLRLISFLAVGHLILDMNQGAIPAILPYLRSAHGLSYAATGVLVLMSNVTSSLVQPIFGHLADRNPTRWMMPLALLLAGLGFSLTGAATGYGMVIVLLVVMGLGIASYHPIGFKTVTSVAGKRKATALSWFSLGGNLGFALGPPVVGALLTEFGIYGSLGMLLPSLAMAALLSLLLPRFTPAITGGENNHPEGTRGKNMPKALAILMLVVMIRSWAQLGFITFLPFYYVDYLKLSPRLVGPLLFAFLGAGAAGTVIAGPLADRWGARALTRWALMASAPFGVFFLLVRGPLAIVMLALFGGILISTFSVSVALSQQYLPGNAGLASGLIVGFAIGAGGLGVTMLGGIADRHGVPVVLWISALLPLAAFCVAFFLPHPQDARHT